MYKQMYNQAKQMYTHIEISCNLTQIKTNLVIVLVSAHFCITSEHNIRISLVIYHNKCHYISFFLYRGL